jgi:antitoxin component YwqK of YwqJK toxin-antitoxin module
MKQKNKNYFIWAISMLIILAILFTNFDYFKKQYLVTFHKSGTISHFNGSGKLNGEVDTYLNGNISRKANFKNGLFDGWTANYYPNGVIMNKYFYRNNIIDSIAFDYYNKGKIKSKESFKNGKFEGPKITYYPNGQIEQRLFRKNNKDEGMENSYYEGGHLKYTRNWVNDNPYGDFYYYYENKTAKIYHSYDILGDKFYLCEYDQSGKVLKSDGYVFSPHTYTVDEDSTKVLLNGNTYKSIKDLYITVANPPQYTPEILIIINKKKCQDLIFPNHNTVLVKNAFIDKGVYNITIDGIFVGKSGTTDRTTGNLRIIKE